MLPGLLLISPESALGPPRLHLFKVNGAGTKNRTRDLLITNQLLYQLSYAGFKKRILYRPELRNADFIRC